MTALSAAAIAIVLGGSPPRAQSPERTAASDRPRVIVSTDIGGTDPDDFQSLVDFLLYAEMFDVEGIVSSPYGPGRREHVLQVLDRYATDYPLLARHSDRYPQPDALRRVTKQGATEDGRQSVGRLSAAQHARRSVASRLGRTIRPDPG